MATGTTYTDFSSEKRLLGVSDFGSRFMEHLRGLVQESTEKSFRTGGVFDTALGLSAGGNDKFDIDGTSQATDGFGHILDIDAFGFDTAVPFENTAAVDYEVALHYAEVPNGVQVNPRKGLPEYIAVEEAIGESADPDLVTDNGANITFRIDSVAEAGVSHAGRTARVWKKTPGQNGTTSAVAIEDAIVTWTGSNNEITTSGLLGQSTVSTTVGDYTVVMLGPTVRRNSALLGVDGYAFLGVVIGVGSGSPPTVFDITDQNVITWSFSNLQDITSLNATTNRLKVDVKSYAGDANDPQIAVKNPAGSNVFTIDGNGNVAIKSTTTLRGMVPESHNTYDIGTSGVQWRHGYFTGIATIGEINLKTTAGNGVGSDLIPDSTDARNLGILARRFAETYTRDLFVGTAAGEGVENLIPQTDVAHDLGSGSYRWNNIFVSNINISGNFLPISDDAQDLGSTTFQWRDLFIDGTANIDTLSLSATGGEGVATDLNPTDDDTFDLGAPSYRWQTLYAANAIPTFLSPSTSAGEGCDDLIPFINGSKALGSASYRWWSTHLNILDVSDASDEGVSSNLVPSDDASFNLGNSSYRWDTEYLDHLDLSISPGEGVVSAFNPNATNTRDLGSTGYQWKDLYLDGTAYLDALEVDGTANIDTLDVDVVANIDTLDLSTVAGEGSSNHLVPTVNNLRDLGNASYLWSKVFQGLPWAFIYSTATQVNTATWAYIAGGSSSSDDDITINTSDFQGTIVKRGIYRIEYQMPVGLFGASGNVIQCCVTLNGGRLPGSHGRCGVDSSVGKNACVGSITKSLTNGDIVRLQIQERTSADGVPGSFSTMGDTSTDSAADRAMSITLVRYE